VTYDSRPDTYKHILAVQTNLARFVIDLMKRQAVHDQSKLYPPEVEAFDVLSPKLAGLTYGTDEYRATLREMKPALAHHYAANRHHPEHFGKAGIRGMNLLDLIEMLCDWKAAGERHADNKGLRHSIEINQQRFGYSDELKQILLNTNAELLEPGE
jgi:hypothetical protein